MRFCQAFMMELFRHVGPDTDVPAGDIGVGAREIGYLFGQYRKLANEFTGSLTGKGIPWGGSRVRAEAAGYGLIYFVEEMLRVAGNSINGKTIAISGSGNVAQSAAEKAITLGAKVVTFSDTEGFVYDPAGIDAEKLAYVKELKNVQRGRIREYAKKYRCQHYDRQRPWGVKCDIALPCATHNELGGRDAEKLTHNSCLCVAEGANMPCSPEAVDIFLNRKLLYAPGKAANAGGVVLSGLEMSQNSERLQWSKAEVDKHLRDIMQAIHNQCVRYGTQDKFTNYMNGANIAGFRKVAESMLDQGLV
jgi:glutamate dehydrogenase/leucine dehydrogenase